MQRTVGPILSRRQLLGATAAVVTVRLAPALFGSSPLQLPLKPGRGRAAPRELSLDRFAPHVGSDFTVRLSAGRRLRLRLVEATDRQPHPADRRGLSGESFSLVFSGRGAKAFDHGTYTVTNPSLGAVPLFLVAVGLARDGQRYQAVINRRVPVR